LLDLQNHYPLTRPSLVKLSLRGTYHIYLYQN
jgi:hypothetical protein